MKILKTLCGGNADLAALDEPVYEVGKEFEARRNGRPLAKLCVVSGGRFPICEVSEAEVPLEDLEMDEDGDGPEVRKTR